MSQTTMIIEDADVLEIEIFEFLFEELELDIKKEQEIEEQNQVAGAVEMLLQFRKMDEEVELLFNFIY